MMIIMSMLMIMVIIMSMLMIMVIMIRDRNGHDSNMMVVGSSYCLFPALSLCHAGFEALMVIMNIVMGR